MINDKIVSDIAKYCVLRNISVKEFGEQHLLIKRKLNNIWKEKTSKYLTWEDIGKVLVFLFINGKKFNINKWRVIYKLVYYTGIYQFELLNLKREDFNFDNCSINIKIVRLVLPRTVFFPLNIRDDLIKYFSSEIEGINVFNLTENQFYWHTRKLKNRFFNGKKFSWHALRVGFRGLLIRSGMDKNVALYLKNGRVENIDLNIIEKEYRERIG